MYVYMHEYIKISDNICHFDVCLDEYPTICVSDHPCEIRTFKLYVDSGECVLDLYCRPLNGGSYTAQLYADQMVGVIVKWIGEYAVMRHCG